MAAAHGGADSRNYTFQDTFTYVTGGGAHTFKTGFLWNRPMVAPMRIGANDNGTFTFRHNLPFDPANARTYPSRFTIVMGDPLVDSTDDWWNGFIQDQWRLTPNLTLNLGLRYDYQQLTPETQAFAPRLGFAFDPFGSGKTIIRGGSPSSTSPASSASRSILSGAVCLVRSSPSTPVKIAAPIPGSFRRMPACSHPAAAGWRSSALRAGPC